MMLNKKQLVKAFEESLNNTKFINDWQKELSENLSNLFEYIQPIGKYLFCAGAYETSLRELVLSQRYNYNQFYRAEVEKDYPEWTAKKKFEYAKGAFYLNNSYIFDNHFHYEDPIYFSVGLLINTEIDNAKAIEKLIVDCYCIDDDKLIQAHSSIISKVDIEPLFCDNIIVPLPQESENWSNFRNYKYIYDYYCLDPEQWVKKGRCSLDYLTSVGALSDKNLISFENLSFNVKNSHHLSKIINSLNIANIKAKSIEELGDKIESGLDKIAYGMNNTASAIKDVGLANPYQDNIASIGSWRR